MSEKNNLLPTKINYIGVGCYGTGLCNQLTSIVNAITSIIIDEKYTFEKNILILNQFCKDIQSNVYCSIKKILDLDYINNYLKDYNIILISIEEINLEIQSIKYGLDDHKVIDITEELKSCLISEKLILINKQIDLNYICGDPIPGIKKKLYLKYSINGHILEASENEHIGYLNDRIYINYNYDNITSNFWSYYLFCLQKKNVSNLSLANTIFKNLKFVDEFYNIVNPVINNLKNNYKHINVIHLRNEKDAINHWSKINKMDPSDFKNILENKYISIIEQCREKYRFS
jgi:hypothetical protein